MRAASPICIPHLGDQRKLYMRLAIAGQYGRMDHQRHAADLYETPVEAVEMLLRHVPLQGAVLEPSAGRGRIVGALRQHGLQVRASDLYDHAADPPSGSRPASTFYP